MLQTAGFRPPDPVGLRSRRLWPSRWGKNWRAESRTPPPPCAPLVYAKRCTTIAYAIDVPRLRGVSVALTSRWASEWAASKLEACGDFLSVPSTRRPFGNFWPAIVTLEVFGDDCHTDSECDVEHRRGLGSWRGNCELGARRPVQRCAMSGRRGSYDTSPGHRNHSPQKHAVIASGVDRLGRRKPATDFEEACSNHPRE